MTTIHVRMTAPHVRRVIGGLVPALTGRDPAGQAVARGLQLRLAQTLLSLLKPHLIDKARGGGGADGQPWAPLAESTIARRLAKAKIPSRKRARRELESAYEVVARTGRGYKKLEKMKKRAERSFFSMVEILRDTGTLFNSLSPGVSHPNQVIEHLADRVAVGTNLYYATFHQHGTARMPARPLWPDALPPAWGQALAEAAASGVADALVMLLTGRPIPPAAGGSGVT